MKFQYGKPLWVLQPTASNYSYRVRQYVLNHPRTDYESSLSGSLVTTVDLMHVNKGYFC